MGIWHASTDHAPGHLGAWGRAPFSRLPAATATSCRWPRPSAAAPTPRPYPRRRCVQCRPLLRPHHALRSCEARARPPHPRCAAAASQAAAGSSRTPTAAPGACTRWPGALAQRGPASEGGTCRRAPARRSERRNGRARRCRCAALCAAQRGDAWQARPEAGGAHLWRAPCLLGRTRRPRCGLKGGAPATGQTCRVRAALRLCVCHNCEGS